MTPETIDLAELARALQGWFGGDPPVGYLRGKALLRDALVEERGFSALEAEELVDTLELNGFLRFLGDPSHRSVADAPWEVRPDAGQGDEPSVEIKPAEPGQVVEVTDEEG